MHESMTKRGGLDADAGDRASDRDGLQLRYDGRHDAVLQGCLDQFIERDQPLDIDPAIALVHFDHMIECARVETIPGPLHLISKQIRCAFR